MRNAPDMHQSEEARMEFQRAQVAEFLNQSRFSGKIRPYTPEMVASLCPSIPVAYSIADCLSRKLYALLCNHRDIKSFASTIGAMDPIQAVQMSKYFQLIYVSGWQCSSSASSSNEPGPDLADYPYDTVPRKVDQLVRALMFHDRKQNAARAAMSPAERAATSRVDYLCPIIADADTGHGGITTVMKLTKMFIEAGAAGIHIEDQRHGAKKCGHMSGKVLVSTKEQIDRLVAARLQADVMNVPLVIVARTDAEASKHIDSDADPRDQPWIYGATNPAASSFRDAMLAAANSPEAASRLRAWDEEARLMTYMEAVKAAMKAAGADAATMAAWEPAKTMSWDDARALANKLGYGNVYWDAQKPRSYEGFYRFCCGVEASVARSVAVEPYADVLWMETARPRLDQAIEFSRGVRSKRPNAMLAYNLSPSFNWSDGQLSKAQIADFQSQLGELGYVWQFITLAGFHVDALGIDRFCKDFQKRHMISYVDTVQKPEAENHVETVKHQKWSGAYLIDAQVSAVQSGMSVVLSSGMDSTESQFK